MTDETAIALGGGAYLGGLCGGALALAAPAGTVGTPAGPLPSPLGPAAVGAIAGLLLGAALARRRLSAADVRALVEAKPRVLATMVPVIVLLVAGVAFWGEGARFWLGLAGVFLAEIGWATVVQTGQNESSAAAIDHSDAVTTLPETQAAPGMSGFLPDLGPLRRVLRAAGALALVAVGGYAWLRRDPFLLVLALPAVALVLPPLSPRPTRVTDRGLVFEQGLGPVGSLGTKLVEWDAFEGYALEETACGSPTTASGATSSTTATGSTTWTGPPRSWTGTSRGWTRSLAPVATAPPAARTRRSAHTRR